jgi:phenylpropionate dioxygenase-like ring-hydroxylating dioxygenase large terminal subunit
MVCEREFPPLPNGWFAVAWANDLGRRQVKPLRFAGRDLVMFRGSDGTVGVFDAYCPHLGTHLGFGGRVKADRIVCPFHHWEFDTNGTCQKIPHSQNIPKKAVLQKWQAREVNKVIQIYHHAADRPPNREPAPFGPIENDSWAPCGRKQYRLQSHPQELSENGADEVHLRTVHGNAVVGSRLVEGKDEFATYFDLVPMLGKRRLPIRVSLDIHIHELGHMTIGTRIGQHLAFYIVQYATPVEWDVVEVRHLYLVKRARGLKGLVLWPVSRILLRLALVNAASDKPIWNHKTFHAAPVLSEGEGMLGRFRRWARQFYQEADEKHAAEVAQP